MAVLFRKEMKNACAILSSVMFWHVERYRLLPPCAAALACLVQARQGAVFREASSRVLAADKALCLDE
ncbi:MAG: hypothetical protein KA972_07960 [Brachymonas sp.]|nr:hypothetical protein [Brachymonas sp.]